MNTTLSALLKIQAELKAPKSQHNSFGKYNYRSLEDICAAAKPLCAKYDCVFTLSDNIAHIEGRHYVIATASIQHVDGDPIVVQGMAREDDSKKGMDASQLTGACSSYARKYAANGLFAIDDTKDADSMDNSDNSGKGGSKKKHQETSEQLDEKVTVFIKAVNAYCDKSLDEFLAKKASMEKNAAQFPPDQCEQIEREIRNVEQFLKQKEGK